MTKISIVIFKRQSIGIANIVSALLLALFLLESNAYAGLFDDAVSGSLEDGNVDEQEAENNSAGYLGNAGGFGFELNGYVRGDVYAGKIPDEEDGEIKSAYGEAALKLLVRKAPYGDAYTELRFRYGYDGTEQDMLIDLREAYINLYLWRFDFRLGQQIIVWGRADGINPTNNLTPNSMKVRSPNEDDMRMSNFGLRMFLNLGVVRLEGVWLPLYRAAELPVLPFPEFISLQEDFPDAALSNGLGAGRFHLELPAVELSLSYLYGHAPTPGLALNSVDISKGEMQLSLERRAYRQHVAGFDFSAPISDWFGLRGEAAYRHPTEEDDHIPNPDLHWVVGVDRDFGSVNVIVQYVGRYVFDRTSIDSDGIPNQAPEILSQLPDPLPDAMHSQVVEQIRNQATPGVAFQNQIIQSQTEDWQHSAFTRIEWKLLQETLSLEVSGMCNFSTWEWLARPKISYDITDALEFTIGGEIYGGPDETLFGMIDELQSAGYLELKVSF